MLLKTFPVPPYYDLQLLICFDTALPWGKKVFLAVAAALFGSSFLWLQHPDQGKHTTLNMEKWCNNKNVSRSDCLKGRIHLVLNKTLMDDTSVKRAQIKTFLCLIQFCWNLVWSCSTHGYYNFTKFQQNWIKQKKVFISACLTEVSSVKVPLWSC